MQRGAIDIPIPSDTCIYDYAYMDSTFVLLSAIIDSLMLQIGHDIHNQSNCVKNILMIPIFLELIFYEQKSI